MDLRLIAFICVVLVNVDAEKQRAQKPRTPTLIQEVTTFLNSYAQAFIDEDVEAVEDMWTEDGEILVTNPGVAPYRGKPSIRDHYDDLFTRIVAFRDFVITVDTVGELENGTVVWATGEQYAYGEEQTGGVYTEMTIYNLTAQFIFERNICDDSLRLHTAACRVHSLADWFNKYF